MHLEINHLNRFLKSLENELETTGFEAVDVGNYYLLATHELTFYYREYNYMGRRISVSIYTAYCGFPITMGVNNKLESHDDIHVKVIEIQENTSYLSVVKEIKNFVI